MTRTTKAVVAAAFAMALGLGTAGTAMADHHSPVAPLGDHHSPVAPLGDHHSPVAPLDNHIP